MIYNDHFRARYGIFAVGVAVGSVPVKIAALPGHKFPDCFPDPCVYCAIWNKVECKVQCLKDIINYV